MAPITMNREELRHVARGKGQARKPGVFLDIRYFAEKYLTAALGRQGVDAISAYRLDNPACGTRYCLSNIPISEALIMTIEPNKVAVASDEVEHAFRMELLKHLARQREEIHALRERIAKQSNVTSASEDQNVLRARLNNALHRLTVVTHEEQRLREEVSREKANSSRLTSAEHALRSEVSLLKAKLSEAAAQVDSLSKRERLTIDALGRQNETIIELKQTIAQISRSV